MKNIPMTSNKQDWQTPRWLFDKLNDQYDFSYDMAASKQNALCDEYFSLENSSLDIDWSELEGNLWCNPPYNNAKAFLKKGFEREFIGYSTIFLIPARTDTRMWHDYCAHASEVIFLKGRLKFTSPDSQDKPTSAPFPSALVTFRPRVLLTHVTFQDLRV